MGDTGVVYNNLNMRGVTGSGQWGEAACWSIRKAVRTPCWHTLVLRYEDELGCDWCLLLMMDPVTMKLILSSPTPSCTRVISVACTQP